MYVTASMYIHRVQLKISFAEWTPCLNFTIIITIKIRSNLFDDIGKKSRIDRLDLTSHCKRMRLAEQVTVGN